MYIVVLKKTYYKELFGKKENTENDKRTCIFFDFVYTTQHTDMLMKTHKQRKS